MVLWTRNRLTIPPETVRVARAVFPKGNVYMTMRDELDIWYEDDEYADLFPSHQGRPAESPGLLVLVTVMQYAEGLTDRQAAEAVRARIDWKYALGLPLEDRGFHFSVLGEFRKRLIAESAEQRLLDDMLKRLKAKGLLKSRGLQRTDSTHVLAAIRKLNRLEVVGETLRAALNALAAAAPDWLLGQVGQDWFDRYGLRFEQYRWPKSGKEREHLAERIGADGHQLLLAIYEESAPHWLPEVPAVDILRQVWIQQYWVQEGQVKWRRAEDLPPNKLLIQSPYDIQARNRTKRSTNWTGYAVHLTETCDQETPNLITHVETTPATTGDVEMTGTIHNALAEKGLLPNEHLVDTSYVDAGHLVTSQKEHQVNLYGPAAVDSSWQAKSETGFDVRCFTIDWDAQTVICPQGCKNRSWRLREKTPGRQVIEVGFSRSDCLACVERARCTKSKTHPRLLTFRPRVEFEALHAARQRQVTPEFKERYKKRAGVEGTVSQGTRSFGLRRSRYVGLAKTHFQHVATAAAMNLTRAVAWMGGIPKAQTRRSHFAALAEVA
jgi:transposase